MKSGHETRSKAKRGQRYPIMIYYYRNNAGSLHDSDNVQSKGRITWTTWWLLTSRNCTSPNSPSSDTHAYAASLCRKSWHNVISSLLNNDPIFHGFRNTTQNKNLIINYRKRLRRSLRADFGSDETKLRVKTNQSIWITFKWTLVIVRNAESRTGMGIPNENLFSLQLLSVSMSK